MDDYIGSLIGRYRANGLLIDTNLLLLYIVGAYDPGQIEGFSRTEQFDPDDFAVLYSFVQRFDLVVTTPHVLTETSNLLGGLSGHVRTGCFDLLRMIISLMREHHARHDHRHRSWLRPVRDHGCGYCRGLPRLVSGAHRRLPPVRLPRQPRG